MKLLLDMNLPPAWCEALARAGHPAVHWHTIGPATEQDGTILAWAKSNDRVVVTHDLDYGALLAATGARGPSVVILRTNSASTPAVCQLLIKVLSAHQADLDQGAIVIADTARSRVRILPL